MHKSSMIFQIALHSLSRIKIINGKKDIRNHYKHLNKYGNEKVCNHSVTKKPLRFSKPSLIIEVEQERTA